MSDLYLIVNKLLNKELRIKLENKKKKDPLNIYKYIDKIVEKLKKYDSEIVLKKMGGNVPHPDIYGNEKNYMLGGGVPHPNIYNENHMENVDFFSSDSDLDKGIIRQGGNICNCPNCKILGGCNKCKSGGCQKINGGNKNNQKLEKKIIEYIKTKDLKMKVNMIKEISKKIKKKIIYHINDINEKNKILILK
tara:strand:+ start:23083 stop:23658 length:576 start_codon:yes stop_codon:yes gene_type:complete